MEENKIFLKNCLMYKICNLHDLKVKFRIYSDIGPFLNLINVFIVKIKTTYAIPF